VIRRCAAFANAHLSLKWLRFPNPAVDGKEGEIEVRQLFELEDFGPSGAVERFREMGIGRKKEAGKNHA